MNPTPNDLIAVTSNLISASAGTGKTYQLASRFVALLALGYKAEEMIALTFTRKAAGEFRNRILKALSDGALDLNEKGKPRQTDPTAAPAGRNGITARVWETWSGLTIRHGKAVPAGNRVALCPDCACVVELAAKAGMTPEDLYAQDDELYKRLQLPRLTAATYRELLADVVNAMSRLTLSTLDSFFNRIVRNNSLTIGIRKLIPLEPEDSNEERRAVLREMIAQTATTAELRRDFLLQYEKLTCGEGRHMMNFLQEQIDSYLTLYRNIHSTAAWGNAEAFDLNEQGVADAISAEQWLQYEQELADCLAAVTENLCPLSKEAAAAVYQLPKDLKAGNFSFLHKHRDPTRANTGSKFNKFFEAPISKPEEQALADCMLRIIEEVKKAYLRAVINKTQGLFYILNRFASAYLSHMRNTGKVGFDDIAMFAYHLMQGNINNDEQRAYAARRITYNLDATFKHWMLDEFQDTSEMQFDTLAPVLTEIAQCERNRQTHAAERSIFVVGDEKQSIYGFRTGETEVFHKLQTQTPWKEVLHPSELEKSYRSSPEIMGENGFINSMFAALDAVEADITAEDNNILQGIGVDDRLSYPNRLKCQFTGHRSATDKVGYTRISVVPEQESNDETRLAFYDSIAQLLQDELTDENSAPKNGMSIAILTRNNSEASELEERLSVKLPKLPILRLGDDKVAATSQLGELLLSFFLWMLHPDDSYRAALVTASPMADLMPHPPSPANVVTSPREQAEQKLRHAHQYWLNELETRGYAAVVRDLLACFPTTPHNLRSGRTAHIWLTESHAFDCVGGTLADWISRIGKAGAAAAASSHYVQIMTMHKSKGLEFDAVILPYISTDAEDELSDLGYFSRKDAWGNVEGLLLNPGNAEKRDAWKEVFTPLCIAKKQHSRREAYNLLYVAATRAKHANYIFCHGHNLFDPKIKKHIKWIGAARSTAGLIRRMLSKQPFAETEPCRETFNVVEEEKVLWAHGEANWFDDSNFIRENQAQDEPAPLALPPLPHSRRKRVSPSALARHEDKPFREAEDTPTGTPFSGSDGADFGTRVHECFEQISRLDAPLPAWLNASTLPEHRVVAAALQQPDVHRLFSPTPEQEVYCEQSIEAVTPDNAWISGSIDRLILTTDAAGRTTAAHIIDFKTNKLHPTDEERDVYKVLMSQYTGQMTAYKQLIHDALGLPAQAITVSLISCPGDGTPACVLTYPDSRLPLKPTS